MRLGHQIARSLGRSLLSRAQRERLGRLHYNNAGHGYDAFGMHPDWLIAARGLGDFMYRRYFRVTAYGAESIPAKGAAFLVANHAGTLPIDAMLLCLDVLEHTDPPRMPRTVLDRFVPQLPFAGVLLSRLGAISGTQHNMRYVLEAGELCLTFPEGLAAIGKPFRERYKLQAWRVGHAEMALRHDVPVIPVAIVGAEEQWPQIGRISRIRLFGAPYLPIPASPIPLPVHYRIHYGTPINLRAHCGGNPHLSAETVAHAAAITRAALEKLLGEALAARRGVFW
jgi:1-acyl-sn-glycerol-3-phosphate acyltransferase